MREEELNPGSNAWRAMVRGQTLTLQIVIFAMTMGILFLVGYVIFSGAINEPPKGQVVSIVAAAMGAMTLVTHIVVPMFIERAAIANQGVGKGPEGLMGAYFIRTLVAAALLEGAALFSAVAVLIEHNTWVLGVTGVLLVLLVMQIPTSTRVEHWLELKLMERER